MDEQNFNEDEFLTEETINKLIDLGKLNFPSVKSAHVLSVPSEHYEEFKKLFYDENSKIFHYFSTGLILSDFEIDSRLYLLAKSGDLKSIQELAKRKKIYEDERKSEIGDSLYEKLF